jgi:predicted nucleic acid-binding protein
MSYLVDTDYVADFLNGRPDAILLLRGLPREQIAISVITFGEVTEGIAFGRDRRRHEQGFRQFLRIADVLPLSRTTMRQFAHIRGTLRTQGDLIPDMDLLIGATAIATNRTLVTRNRRHFNRLGAFGLTLHP